MKPDNVKNIIKKVIVDSLELLIEPSEIVDNQPLFSAKDDGLDLDSLEALEITIGLEDYFEIEIESSEHLKEDFYSVETLGKLVNRILSA